MIIIIIVIIMIIFIIIIMINDHDYHHFQINHDTKGPRAVPAPVCVWSWSHNSVIIFYLSSSHRCHIHHHNRPASGSSTCLWNSNLATLCFSTPTSSTPRLRSFDQLCLGWEQNHILKDYFIKLSKCSEPQHTEAVFHDLRL